MTLANPGGTNRLRQNRDVDRLLTSILLLNEHLASYRFEEGRS
jgi:hypothetical protein